MSSFAQPPLDGGGAPGPEPRSHDRAHRRARLISRLGVLAVAIVAAAFVAWISKPVEWGAVSREPDGVAGGEGAPKVVSSEPQSGRVTIARDTPRRFSVVLDGVDPGDPPRMRWVLDGKLVAEATATWEYDPGRWRPRRRTPGMLQFILGTGRTEAQRAIWWLETEPTRLSPVLLSASHEPGSTIRAALGEAIELTVDAYDPDGDPLDYAWQIDGRPAGRNAPRLEVPVRGSSTVSLAITDGDATVRSTWKIEATAPGT